MRFVNVKNNQIVTIVFKDVQNKYATLRAENCLGITPYFRDKATENRKN